MQVRHVLETSLYVDDLARAERFYVDVLGLTLVGQPDKRHVFLRCGQRMLLLFNPLVSREPAGEIPPHGSFVRAHVAFGVTEDSLDTWSAWLTERSVAIERIIAWPQGGRSLYFRDPAGNSLELATPRIWGIGDETLD